MKNRNPILVFVFGLITVGIYSWYWSVKTKGELNNLGEKIPTAWIWLIPIVGLIWWFWKYSEGVEHVTQGKTNGVLAFIILWFLGPIGNAIIQDSYNKLQAVSATAGVTPGAPTPPIVSGDQPPVTYVAPAQTEQAIPAPVAPVDTTPVSAPEATPAPVESTAPASDPVVQSDSVDPTQPSPPATPPIGSV